MGCNCGKKKRLPTVAASRAAASQRWAGIAGKKYKNVSEETLVSRIPRLSIEPGAQVDLGVVMISHSIRTWIRSGALEPEPESNVA